jgi:hypothetical protein
MLVNEKRTYVTDVFTMCIDHFTIADVLVSAGPKLTHPAG